MRCAPASPACIAPSWQHDVCESASVRLRVLSVAWLATLERAQAATARDD